MIHRLLIVSASVGTAGVGGVTIHTQRLMQWLDKYTFVYDLCDYKSTSYSKLLKIICSHKYVHIHISNPIARLICALLCKLAGAKALLTIHGNLGRFSTIGNIADRIAIKISDVPILINKDSYYKAVKWNSKSQFIPAFIPPAESNPLDENTQKTINFLKSTNKIICSTNAYNVSLDKNGNEIYGISFLCNYFKDKNDYILLVSDPSGNYHKRIGNCGDNVYFIDYRHNYFELLKRVDVFIRNTSTDGDSLSVKESLYLGCKTICTDSVNRPEGCVLFKYNNEKSLETALASVASEDFKPVDVANGAESLLKLYKDLM